MDEARGRRGYRALSEPPVGLRQRLARRFCVGFGGANLVRACRQLRRRHLRLQACHLRLVARELGAGVIDRGGTHEAARVQLLLPAQVRRGEVARRHRLAQLFGDRLHLGGALARLQVREPCQRGLQLLLRLPTGGHFVVALQCEHGRTDGHLAAASDRQLLQLPGERRRDPDVLALDIAEQRAIGRRTAAGDDQHRQQAREP